MALLQAARAYLLGMPEDTAKSWGLNRAIFYAAAKRGFRQTSPRTSEFRGARSRSQEDAIDVYRLGDDMAFKEERDGRIFFTIGGKIQTAKDFERQVELRFSGMFSDAWQEALQILRQFDRRTLLSQQGFYEQVYRPRRDALAAKWTELSVKKAVKPPAG